MSVSYSGSLRGRRDRAEGANHAGFALPAASSWIPKRRGLVSTIVKIDTFQVTSNREPAPRLPGWLHE
jgi:hypothetical protein